MKKLLPFLKGYEKESIIGPLFKLLEATLELIVPIVMAKIIDEGIRESDIAYVWKMGAILVGFGILGLSCSLLAQYFAAKAAVGFGTKLRHVLFAHIGKLSYSEIDKAGSATLVVRMTSDINQVQAGINLVLRLFLRSPFIVIGALIMSFTIDKQLSIIFLIAVPILSFVIYGVIALTIPLYKRVQKALDTVLSSARENLVGIRVIRAFRTQKKEEEEYEKKNNVLMQLQLLVGRISALLNPVTYVLVNIGIIAVVWFGSGAVNQGRITQGEVIALVNYMSQILLALVALASLIISFTKALASAGRIEQVFALQSSIAEGTEKEGKVQKPRVEMRQATFFYQDSKESALKNISLCAAPGQTIGIIGGTGCGKTSLVNLIPRFYDVSEGQVLVNGLEVKEWKLDSLRERIGIVPQRAVLFHGTIRANMQMGKKDASDAEIYEALRIAQALEIVEEKAEALDTVIREGGKNLSGGQRQRLTIARALVRKPEILILDDSASALDFTTDYRLRKALAEETNDMTVFLVSQRASSIMHADQILVLEDGQLAGQGTHEELLDCCSVYREICYSQLAKKEVEKHEKDRHNN